MFEVLAPVGKLLFPYIPEISISLVACLLVILGGEINRLLRKLIGGQHFIVRTMAFILLNAFGYGIVIVKLSPYLSAKLTTLDSGTLFVSVLVSFIIIGIWAQKNRHV